MAEQSMIAELDAGASDFDARLDALLQWDVSEDAATNRAAREILDQVRAEGDAALLALTRRFDHLTAASMAALTIDADGLQAALDGLPAADRAALTTAAERIRAYHERQRTSSWRYEDEHGNQLGQRVTPLERVGLYVPGGQASYPSSVLMTAIPAQVAGVDEIVMVVPTPEGSRNPLVLAAAALAGVHRVFCIGGAQAIGALAYGTETVPRVDKIVGPGGAFVAAAKRMVFGPVGIDMIAGPSEILVVSDGSASPEWIAADLFSQAEHDEAAQAILLTPDPAHRVAVRTAMQKLLGRSSRRDVIERALAARGALIHVRDLSRAIEVVNRIAPEHLELAVAEPERLLERVRHAGAVFLGTYTAEVIGDYVAGPSHVLPTFGTARFSSPLGVADFEKRTSLIGCSPQGASALGRSAATLARGEGLTAHARSAELRIAGFNDNRPDPPGAGGGDAWAQDPKGMPD